MEYFSCRLYPPYPPYPPNPAVDPDLALGKKPEDREGLQDSEDLEDRDPEANQKKFSGEGFRDFMDFSDFDDFEKMEKSNEKLHRSDYIDTEPFKIVEDEDLDESGPNKRLMTDDAWQDNRTQDDYTEDTEYMDEDSEQEENHDRNMKSSDKASWKDFRAKKKLGVVSQNWMGVNQEE